MNLDERIESAWKEQSSEARKWLQCSRESQLLRAAGFGFEEGYRAAMRSLYVEVKPENRQHRAVYDCELRDGQWVRLMHFAAGHAYWDCHRENSVVYDDVLRTVRLDVIPSPAEIFGN